MLFKTIVFSALFLNIILQNGKWIFETCNIDIAKQAIPPVIWYEQSIDGQNQRTLFTRFLHNKPGIFLSQAGRCYFQALDPYLLYKIIGPLGLLSMLYIIYKLVDTKKYPALILFFALPILPFVDFPQQMQIYLYKFISILGILSFLKDINDKS